MGGCLASPVSRIDLLCLREVIAGYLLVVTWEPVGLDQMFRVRQASPWGVLLPVKAARLAGVGL